MNEGTGTQAADGATNRTSSGDDIRALVDQATASQSETDRFVPLHTEDAIIVNIAGRRVMGKVAIEEAMRVALATPLANAITSVDVDDVRFVTDDVALVSCTKYVSDQRDPSDKTTALPAAGRLTYVMVRSGEHWRIALAQTTPIASA